MTAEEAYSIFLNHDTCVKDLRSHPLSPLLRNLDRVRKEFQVDGTVIERTAREWARNLKTSEGISMQADVVNGGDDLLCYLVFPSAFAEEAARAVDQYRNVLYPFTQREARFRESVGPPPEIHLSKRVIANLDFVKRRIAARQQSTPATAALSTAASTSTTSSVSQVSRPMTPVESLRQRYRQINPSSEEFSVSSSTSDAIPPPVQLLRRPSKVMANFHRSQHSYKIFSRLLIARRKHLRNRKHKTLSNFLLSNVSYIDLTIWT